jgi:hypothetical protein
VKVWLFPASIAWLTVFGACSFDSRPVLRNSAAREPVGSEPDAQLVSPAMADAAQGDALVELRLTDASLLLPDGAPADATLGTDADTTVPTHPIDPPPIPSSGGLECGGMPCPFAPLPAKQCCTTQVDVTQRTARAPDRCGLDLNVVSSQLYGDGCWQRDQLGIVDDRCPSAAADPAVMPEPGCCTDDGQCGTINASQKLGCRHALGSDARPCQDPATNTTCDPTGTFGVHFNVDAAWGGRSGGLVGLTDDGRGKIQVYMAVSIQHVDATTHELNAAGRVCGVTLPPFYSTTLCEAYLPQFPNQLWESSALPHLAMSGRYECSGAGCVLSLNPQTYLLGFDLANPEAPWPTSSQTATLQCPAGRQAQCFPDHDGDGKPGVQLNLATTGQAPAKATACPSGYGYRGTPVSASIAAIFDGVRRANRLQLGARMKTGGSFRLGDDCATARGSAVAEYVDSRAYGCLIEPGTYDFPLGARAGANELCTSSEAQFMDANLPVYELLSAGATPKAPNVVDKSASRGPEISVVRLGAASAAVSCAAVLAAKY